MLVLLNKSAQTIYCIINDELRLILYPHKSAITDTTITGTVKLQLLHTYGSCYGEYFKLDGMRQIVLNTTFLFTDILADSVICISREKVHFEFRYTYDRFFCNCSDAHILQEVHDVADLNNLCSAVSNVRTQNEAQDSFLGFMLEGHFLQSTILFVIFKLCFWANEWAFPWWLILIFWSVGYLLRLFGERLFNVFQKKYGTHEYHMLQKYTSLEYIQQYYANPTRKCVANDIERE